MYYICQLTVDLYYVYRAPMDIVAYRASDMHGMYFHIVARHSSIRHGVYYYVVFRLLGVLLLLGSVYYAGIRLLLDIVFLSERICVVGICCGCPPFFCFVPFPTERLLNGNPSPV